MEQPIIKTIPSCTIYTAEKEMTSWEEIQPFVNQCIATAVTLNPKLKVPKEDYCFGCYPLQDLKKKKFIYKYCQAIKKAGEVEANGIKFVELPETTVLSFTVQGPYKDLLQVYEFLFEYFKINKTIKPAPDRLVREVYIKGIWNEKDPKKYVTEYQVPIIEEDK